MEFKLLPHMGSKETILPSYLLLPVRQGLIILDAWNALHRVDNAYLHWFWPLFREISSKTRNLWRVHHLDCDTALNDVYRLEFRSINSWVLWMEHDNYNGPSPCLLNLSDHFSHPLLLTIIGNQVLQPCIVLVRLPKRLWYWPWQNQSWNTASSIRKPSLQKGRRSEARHPINTGTITTCRRVTANIKEED